MKPFRMLLITVATALPLTAQQGGDGSNTSSYESAAETYREIRSSYQNRRAALDRRLSDTDERISSLEQERAFFLDRNNSIDRDEALQVQDAQRRLRGDELAKAIQEANKAAARDRTSVQAELEAIDRVFASAKTKREAILAQIEALPEPPIELRPRGANDVIESARRTTEDYFRTRARSIAPITFRAIPKAWLHEHAKLTR
ncbi:MAG: hypothetical protein AAF196_16245 [Planctomycetota bacterium]